MRGIRGVDAHSAQHRRDGIRLPREHADIAPHLGQRSVPVVWIGRRTIDLTRSGADAARPIRVSAGAFGEGLPHADLVLSPHHAVFVDGVLVPIRCLVNRGSIARDEQAKTVTYLHIEMAAHDVVFAEGLPAESWLDTGNRAMFSNAPTPSLRSDMAPGLVPVTPCAPVVTDGPALAGIRARLDAVAHAIGRPAPAEIVINLDRIGDTLAILPAGVGVIRLVSTSATSQADRRQLGALVTALRLEGAAMTLEGNITGFHAH
jgi:hypothetical protein